MAIEALFEHEDGYLFPEVYATKSKFLATLRRGVKNASFLHAIDYDRAIVIRQSNLPEYRAMK